MRVVFNQWAASGQKTGIGHHAAQLRHHLPEFAGADEVRFFPPAWVVRYRELWGRLTSGQSGSGGDIPSLSPLRWARTWARLYAWVGSAAL